MSLVWVWFSSKLQVGFKWHLVPNVAKNMADLINIKQMYIDSLFCRASRSLNGWVKFPRLAQCTVSVYNDILIFQITQGALAVAEPKKTRKIHRRLTRGIVPTAVIRVAERLIRIPHEQNLYAAWSCYGNQVSCMSICLYCPIAPIRRRLKLLLGRFRTWPRVSGK
jgi:hypothetical protein